jgi:hypothetical protein
MTKLMWDAVGERSYETGVDHGVLYIPDEGGAYVDGVAWNGLTTVTEKPSGAAPNAQYADNMKYLNLVSAEEFAADIEAFTYPVEFSQFDGLAIPTPGVTIGQQSRRSFGLCYRTLVGDDVNGDDAGYKLHLVYGCQAAPSQKAYQTVNNSPAAIKFVWALTTTPVAVPNLKPTSTIVVDSRDVDATALADLERILYGDVGVNPALPLPATVISLFSGTVVEVSPTVPTYDAGTHTITVPTEAGVTYYVNGESVAAGPLVIATDTVVQARPDDGYVFTPGVDDDWEFLF